MGGTVSGLTGAGLVLANGATTLSVAAGATTFAFPAALAANASYNVVVQTQPSGQTCYVASGSGTITAPVTNVAVSCGLTVGGTLSGLTDTGLVLALTGTKSATLTVAANATSFTMPAALVSGNTYTVAVQTQPAGNTCTVQSGATGQMASANVTNVTVTCVNKTFALGGTITGLTAAGVQLGNGGNSVQPAANATTFTLPTNVAFGASYNVTVQAQAAGVYCAVTSGGTGTMPSSAQSNIVVTCQPALQKRNFNGDGVTIGGYYDPAQKITWLANYNAGASTSYDNGKFNNDGRMTWVQAQDWATHYTLGSVSGWRLPTMVDTGLPGCPGEFSLIGGPVGVGTSCGQNIITTPQITVGGVVKNSSEMGYLNHVILGNKPAFNTTGGNNPQPWLANSAPFVAAPGTLPQGYNVVFYNAANGAAAGCPNTPTDPRNCRDDAFWSGLQDASTSGSAWKYMFGSGEQTGDDGNVEYFAWAVHDGDVGVAIP